MSQAGIINTTSGPVPPDVPTEIETPDGNATPENNTLSFTAYDSPENNDNGITIKGGTNAGDPPGTGTGNEVSYYLTNRVTGTATTAAVETVTVLTFDVVPVPPFVPPFPEGIFNLVVDVEAYNADPIVQSGSTWHIEGALLYDGAGGLSTVGTQVRRMIGDDALFDVTQVTLGFSGDNITVSAEGSGGPVRWRGLLTYRFTGGV